MSFRFLEHTADVKIEVSEKNLEKAFATSAIAMRSVMAEKIKVRPKLKKEISVHGIDREALLYKFLEEFLYQFDANDFVLSEVKSVFIKKEKNRFVLKASLTGDKAKNYKFTNDVKAVTYNDMLIKEEKGKVLIRFVVDV